MPEEKRVFDVSKPGYGTPQATSRPVIVGHQPILSDPMVREREHPGTMRITVQSAEGEAPKNPAEADVEPPNTAPAGDIPVLTSARRQVEPPISLPEDPPAEEPAPEEEIPPTVENSALPAGGVGVAAGITSSAETAPLAYGVPPAENPPAAPSDQPTPPADLPIDHVKGLHVAAPRRRKSPLALVILIILILAVAAYLLIDAGVIGSGINLPFHVFKQKTPVAASPPTAKTSQPAVTQIPDGFTNYKLAGTAITFAAPTAWGTPTSNTEQGYSARGGSNKTAGTYAYIVDFPNNKDVELAVTSSQYLPPVRTALYYDFLQWCTGTNDGKIYLSVLNFTTTDKIDTPSTITCNQGPLANAAKLNATTIVQHQVKYVNGSVLGDLYTKNLSNSNLSVFRVKDASSNNAGDIKQLLATVQESAAPTSGASDSSASP